jgi:hypothetical protein
VGLTPFHLFAGERALAFPGALELSDEAITVAIEAFRRVPSPTSAIAFEQLGGAVARVGEADTAFGHRDAPFIFLVVCSWPDAADDATHIDWTRSVAQAMQPFSSGGVYVNYLGQETDEGRERIRAANGLQSTIGCLR